MCERRTKKYACSRCSNFMFISTPREIDCQWKGRGKCCGRLEQIDVIKCEPALCTRCSSFPANPLPFVDKPDVPPLAEHDVRRSYSLMNKKEQDHYIRDSSLQKTRKTYLTGATNPAQEERNAELNWILSRWLTRRPELMKIKEPTDEAKEDAKNELEDDAKQETKEDPEDNTNNESKQESKEESEEEDKKGSGEDFRKEPEDTKSNKRSKKGPKAKRKGN
ncbi:hypothetical protein FVEN_g5554 [Fusarium venenatum]|uniref:Uncharacterized protein n=1 Tax=Fusarium venenatum TaxID=56646 RepID=A0A2L2TBD1_9HYPO|nr:uncharacterized protein FVRRES_08351 [Fusarium venenatum]KAG8356691.1 hypothetical protein FVEN_g5554 [Fusarium venenatum]KAH6965136.1 hypothetical protein EDB82DRAFT_479506 [Fusarium venenatum]CEI68274.1 unnamed protein product [Fusarium venenatum]